MNNDDAARDRKRYKTWISVKGFLVPAAILSIMYFFSYAMGWRQYAGFLSGTNVALGSEYDLLFGIIYVLSYFALVIVVPIFIFAAGLFAILQWAILGRNN